MPGDVNIAATAALLADPTRANIVLTLSDGRALPAGELARSARVGASTASAHLARLVESGLLTMEKQGRHRYYRLADPAIVQAIEILATFSPAQPVRSLRESEVGGALRAARMCYNHIAGALGVALAQALVERQILRDASEGYLVTESGARWLSDFGINFKARGNLVVPHHIDWSERRYHVAGKLGAAITTRLLELEWLRRLPSSRAVRLTESGRHALREELGLQLPQSHE